jgi:putative transposase
VRYAWIARHKAQWPVTLTCEVLEVSASGYFEHWRKKDADKPSRPGANKRISNEGLLVHIKVIHAEFKEEYGWPKMWKELLARGIRVGKERVRKMMQRHGIKARRKRKSVVTTDSKHDLPIAPNLLQRNFTATAPKTVWTSDITYIATDEGWLYLTAVIDLFSRQVVGWSMQEHMQASMVADALRMAWFRRRPVPGLIFHSDRGSHYRWPGWLDRMHSANLTRSMSRKGYSPDNAACEGFFGRLKNEMFYLQDRKSTIIEVFIRAVHEYILWYNKERIKISFCSLSPIEYRESLGLIS